MKISSTKKCIITYQGDAFEYILKKLSGKIKKLNIETPWGCESYFTKNFIVIKMKGVGSPHAVLMIEELIALGVNEFLNIGIAG